MTEKAQRELYLMIRKSVDLYNKKKSSTEHPDSLFIGILSAGLEQLLTSPQFRLNQLDYFDFLR